ncbi:MAG: hypothetical protein LQ342_004442 [Letrouitia transgressa]|nr:MAG: hypothetical protein LQ342_004442 [Letrouitia transgressa]
MKLNGHLSIDDGLVALSVIMLAAISIMQTAYVETTFNVQAVRTEHRQKPPDFERITKLYAHYQWAIAYLFFTGIWAVKGSFLAFYDQLTQRLPRARRAWWIAIIITVLTYIGSLFAYAFLNGNQFKQSLRNKGINYQFAADMTTDVIITAIPLSLALKSSIPTKQKLTLAVVFSMTLVITIFSIVRYAVNNPSRPPAGPSWLQVWSSIEHSVSICVASAASFRAFVVQRSHAAEKASSGRGRHQLSSYLAAKKARAAAAGSSGFSRLGSRTERSGDSEEVELVHTPAKAAVSEPERENRGSGVNEV